MKTENKDKFPEDFENLVKAISMEMAEDMVNIARVGGQPKPYKFYSEKYLPKFAELRKKADDLEKVLESIDKDNKQRDEIEDYKRRISALVDEAERVVGHRIESVVVTPQVYLMSRRQVKFNIVL